MECSSFSVHHPVFVIILGVEYERNMVITVNYRHILLTTEQEYHNLVAHLGVHFLLM